MKPFPRKVNIMTFLLLLLAYMPVFANFDQDFFNLINLDNPSMSAIKVKVQAGLYDSAYKSYRDTLLLRLRRTDMGQFGWHSYQTNPRPLSFALRLVDSMTEATYEAQSSGVDFMDTRNMSGAPGTIGTIRWDTPLVASAAGKDDYSWFKQFTPLAVKFYLTRSKVYADKYFELVGQFATNQKTQVLALPAASQTQFHCNYSQDAQTALNQGFRVNQMFRQIALIAKSLGPNDPKPAWDAVLQANSTPLTRDRLDLIDARAIAHIVYSLIVDHPYSMFQRYQSAGSVPNQRFQGLSALMIYPVFFSEFKTMQTDLGPKVDSAMADYARGNFFDDGAMLEQSFNYNQSDLGSMSDLFRIWSGTPLSPAMIALQKGKLYFERVLAASSFPTGGLPRNGNDDFGIPAAKWTTAPNDPTLKASAFSSFHGIAAVGEDKVIDAIGNQIWGTSTDSLPFTSVAFPHMGYYSLRKDYTTTSPFLWINAARQSRGHDSPDANSVQVEAFGRVFLIGAGVQWYDTTFCPAALRPEFNQYNQYFSESSTWKSNTIMVDGMSQNRGGVAVEAYPTYKKGRWYTSDHLDLVESTWDQGYDTITSVTHFRRVVFLKDLNAWLIHDHMENTGMNKHTYTQLWNYSPEFANNEVTFDASKKTISTKLTSGPNLETHLFSKDSLSFAQYYASKGTPYLGWYKAGLGSTPLPKNDVHVKFTGKSFDVISLIVARPGTVTGVVSQQDLSTDSTVSCKVVFDTGDTLVYLGLRDASHASITQKSSTGNSLGIVLSSRDSVWNFQGIHTKLPFADYALITSATGWKLTEILQPNAFSWKETAAIPYPLYNDKDPRFVNSTPSPVNTTHPRSLQGQGSGSHLLLRFNLLGQRVP